MLGQTSANDPVDALRSPGWNYGFYVGGSESFANTPSVQTFLIAGRIGRVLTHQLGSNARTLIAKDEYQAWSGEQKAILYRL